MICKLVRLLSFVAGFNTCVTIQVLKLVVYVMETKLTV